jgi:hypothetical protein
MLLNRTLEGARRWSLRGRLLRQRALAVKERRPLVLVPGMLGTRLIDGQGRSLWGTTRRLYQGPSIGAAPGVRTDGLLAELSLIPRLLGYDIHGGLLRFLEAVGGYRRGEDLFALDYDWRLGVAHGAECLAELVLRIRGMSDVRVDLLSVSTGGQIVRHYLRDGQDSVRRVLFVGAPQRGTFDALACLHRGFRCAPAGKLFTAPEIALYQTAFDALPHPAEKVFVDEEGNALDLDLYDPSVWAQLGLSDAPLSELSERLACAREVHRALGEATPIPDATLIGARHLPTPHRVLVRSGRACIPPPTPRKDDPFVGYTYAPGDGELTAASLGGLPGIPPDRVWWVTPSAHHRLPADPAVHRLVLEALLATDRKIPTTSLDRS